MDEEFDFEALQEANARLATLMDQAAAIHRGQFVALAAWERECLGAGMSSMAAALYTMKLADAFGWPPTGGSS